MTRATSIRCSNSNLNEGASYGPQSSGMARIIVIRLTPNWAGSLDLLPVSAKPIGCHAKKKYAVTLIRAAFMIAYYTAYPIYDAAQNNLSNIKYLSLDKTPFDSFMRFENRTSFSEKWLG